MLSSGAVQEVGYFLDSPCIFCTPGYKKACSRILLISGNRLKILTAVFHRNNFKGSRGKPALHPQGHLDLHELDSETICGPGKSSLFIRNIENGESFYISFETLKNLEI